MSRLTALHINLIGAGTALVLALILFFALIKPKQDQTQVILADAASVEQAGGTDLRVKAHQKDLKAAESNAVMVEAQWEVNRARYMPNLNLAGPDVLATYTNTLQHLPTLWGRWVTNWYDYQKRFGIKRLPGTDFALPAFQEDPNIVSKLPYLKFPQVDQPWNVRLSARDFNAALANLERINGMARHGMPVINNVALAGQSPDLEMDYTLQLFIILSGNSAVTPYQPPAADPSLTGAAGGGPQGSSGSSYGSSGGGSFGRPSGRD